jgi:hypothetical protein
MSTVGYITGLWIPYVSRVLQQLTSTQDDWWVYTIIPVMVCLIGVNLFFRHFVAITWFSVKVLISVVVYSNIRYTFVETIGSNPLPIDSNLFGLATGTFEFSRSLGLQIAKSRAFAALEATCPICFPHPPDTPPPPPPPPPVEHSTLFGLTTTIRSRLSELFTSVYPYCFPDTTSNSTSDYYP